MQRPPHDVSAPKRTVSLTLNSDLYAQAKNLGINVSRIATQALAEEVRRRKAEKLRSELLQDLRACDAYVTEYGAFADMVREHYEHERHDDGSGTHE